MGLWYISFATDEGFRGATVVAARSPDGAVSEATARGLNPGGEAAVLLIPKQAMDEPSVKQMLNRLLTLDEMVAAGARRLGDLDDEDRDAFERNSVIVCKTCN